MNKILISLLSLTGVAGLSTGGYFLLRGSEEKSGQERANVQGSGGEEASASGAPSGGSGSEPDGKSNQDGAGSSSASPGGESPAAK